MENAIQNALVDYVLGAFDRRSPDAKLAAYIRYLASGKATALTQIATAAGQSAGKAQPPHLLDHLDDFVLRSAGDDFTSRTVFSAFATESEPSYEKWIYLVRRAATAIQGRQGEAGVSLYHEFKILSAMAHATKFQPENLEKGFLLAAGDFPGVQSFIYDIPSDGATKIVRGRSFFLQLLADCTVFRLLAAAGDLPITNALYVAGGKFRLLLPADLGQTVEETAVEINRRLLKLYGGQLRLILATVPMPVGAIANAEEYQDVNRQLSENLRLAKTQPFREFLDTDAIDMLLEPQIDTLDEVEPDLERKDPYAQLALDLARTQNESPHLVFRPQQMEVPKVGDYTGLLGFLTGWQCKVLSGDQLKRAPQDKILALNDFRFENTGADGFRLLAAWTPRAKEEDVTYWEETYEGKDIRRDDEQKPEPDKTIRNFEFLAVQGGKAKRLKRYGVLRMDVDNLGKLFVEHLQPATLTRYVALSDSLSLFFEGYVPQICHQLEAETQRSESLYLIYGGGDDLFVVGEWDLLPELAWRIRERFHQFSNGTMSISAGLVLLTARFPFYRAAEMAREALDDRAKEHGRNAICLFDAVLNWDQDWHTVREQHDLLMQIARHTGSSITQNIMEIYSQWLEESKDANSIQVVFGPYKWRAAYQMSRLAKLYKDKGIDKNIRQIQQALLNPETIRLSGPAARWAELELRTKGASQGDKNGRAFNTT